MNTVTPLTALIITKDEASAIGRCIRALDFCDQVLVFDSDSKDRTIQISTDHGADVIQFRWDGKYPKKKQWAMSHPAVRNDWVLHIDADEVVSPLLAREIRAAIEIADTSGTRGFTIPLEYHFAGRALRHGHRVKKRALVDRRFSNFPEVGDLDAPGITEVEGHYQPIVQGKTRELHNPLIHDDPDPLHDWIARHNRYSDWEAYLRTNPKSRELVKSNRSEQGRLFDRLPFKPAVFFIYSYVIRLGFLDGRAGFDYAWGLAWYYWLTSMKVRENAGWRA